MMDYNEMCKKYERLIYKTVGKFHINGYDYDDMVNLGRYVLWVCCKSFDESKGYCFSTYLVRALQCECYKLHKFTMRGKRAKDKDRRYLDDICTGNGDLTYTDVLYDTNDFQHLEECKQEMLELTNRLPKEDKELIENFIHHKLYINQDYTIKEYCIEKGISYTKFRRIIDDYKYVIGLEWGL